MYHIMDCYCYTNMFSELLNYEVDISTNYFVEGFIVFGRRRQMAPAGRLVTRPHPLVMGITVRPQVMATKGFYPNVFIRIISK